MLKLIYMLECIRLMVKFPESLNAVITNPKFPSALRLHLTSHKDSLRSSALLFLTRLLEGNQSDRIINFLSEIGLLSKFFFIVLKIQISYSIAFVKKPVFHRMSIHVH